MVNDFEAVPGRKFMLKSGPYPKIGFDGNIFCEVLEVIPVKSFHIHGNSDRLPEILPMIPSSVGHLYQKIVVQN
jgi:hypothetical protein